MGASAFTVCSAYGFIQFAELGMKCDPSRMAANVASGVGFVGAGVITTSAANQQNVVHGLTTAATIWLSAAVGVACGVGLLRVATTAALTTITILRLGRRKPRNRKSPGTVTKISSTLSEVISRAEDHVEVDDDDEAEIHDTSDWDEHHDEDQEEEILIPANKRFVLEEDPDMEAVVISAWRNSTHQDLNAETIEQFSTTQRNRTDDAHLP
jgi:putative Mg2+ transporter-C (MgtC) family protein